MLVPFLKLGSEALLGQRVRERRRGAVSTRLWASIIGLGGPPSTIRCSVGYVKNVYKLHTCWEGSDYDSSAGYGNTIGIKRLPRLLAWTKNG